MSGRFQEGFDWLPSGATPAQLLALLEAAGWYSPSGGNTLAVASPGIYGYGQALGFNGAPMAGGQAFQLVRPIGAHNAAGGWLSAGFHFPGYFDNYPFLGVFDAANNINLATVTFEANGVVRVWRGLGAFFGGVLLAQSDPGAFRMQTDFDVEVHFLVSATAGDVEVRINGVSVVHAIDVDTQPGANAYFDAICWGWQAINNLPVAPTFHIDNLRHYDTAGSINNSWLGTRRVQSCFAAGNGATLDFTRSNTGLANWQNILNFNVDDTLYLYDSNVGDFNLSTLQPLVNSPVVDWVGVLAFYRQDDASQITARTRIVSAGVSDDGQAFNTAQAYSGDLDVFELDPATGLQFTGAAVNALQVGPLLYAVA